MVGNVLSYFIYCYTKRRVSPIRGTLYVLRFSRTDFFHRVVTVNFVVVPINLYLGSIALLPLVLVSVSSGFPSRFYPFSFTFEPDT